MLPPLLTVAIFLWIGNTITDRLLVPLEDFARWAFVEAADIRSDVNVEIDGLGLATIEGHEYKRTGDSKFVPLDVYSTVQEDLNVRNDPMPHNAKDIYRHYIDLTYLPRKYVIPVFVGLLVLFMYLLGKFMAAGMGPILLEPIRTPDPPRADRAQRLFLSQTGYRLFVYRSRHRIHAGSGRRISAEGHLVAGVGDWREHAGHSLRCQ